MTSGIPPSSLIAERHRRLQQLFSEAGALTLADRHAYLAGASGGDVELQHEVSLLLAEDGAASTFLDAPALTVGVQTLAGSLLPADGTARPVPGSIGPFRVFGLLGEGGMGIVYEAEQDRPRRRVALKVIKPGMSSAAVLARFGQEREALAVMDHPNVAKVFDAGETPEGYPYFVMELVRGEPITTYCDDHKLTIRQRLDLFIPLCEAVQHAHRKGIIHRDLKPSNILVVRHGEDLTVKVIDFGVAKSITPTVSDVVRTESGQLIGTPEYLSPEQAETGRMDIDTRTDVYSLGVVLYELLTGLLPLDPAPLRRQGYAAIQTMIREQEPPRPSTRLSAMGVEAADIARRRQAGRFALARVLRDELEWIPMKALRKRPDDRYQSPEDLARDVRRYVEGQALEAGPEKMSYRLKKWARRHKLASAIAILLVLGIGGTTSGWLAAAHRAEGELKARTRADKTIEFFKQALTISDPEQGGDAVVQAKAALSELETGAFSDEPETEADIRSAIATVLLNRGAVADAEALYASSLAIYKRIFVGDHQKVASALNDLGGARFGLGSMTEAEDLFRQAYDMNRRLHPGDHAEIAASLNNLAYVRQERGYPEQAEPLFAQVLEMNQRLYAGDHKEVATSLNNLGYVRQLLDRKEEARILFEQSLDMTRRVLPPDHPDIARGLNNLALLRQEMGNGAGAEAMLVQVVEFYQRAFEGDHPKTAVALNNLAYLREKLGRPADALVLYQRSLDMTRNLHPGDHSDVAIRLGNVALCLHALERDEEAEPLARDALEMFRRIHKGNHPDVANSLNTLGSIRTSLKRLAEAEPLFEQAVEMHRLRGKAGEDDLATCLDNVAYTRHKLGKAAEARRNFDEAMAILRRQQPPAPSDLARVLGRSARARLDDGDAGAALPEFMEAVELAQRDPGFNAKRLQEYREGLAQCNERIRR